MMNKIAGMILPVCFCMCLGLPLISAGLEKSGVLQKVPLNGVTAGSELSKPALDTVMDGTFQSDVDDYVKNNIPGRERLIRMRGQAMFSLFKRSPNSNIAIGNDGTLFENWYCMSWEKVYEQLTEERADELADMLTVFDEWLNAQGKELYVFVTPNKVRYYEEEVPSWFREGGNYGYMPYSYDTFMERMGKTDVKVYDAVKYIDAYKKTAEAPLFYKTGTHWSWVTGASVTADFIDYIDKNSAYDFPKAAVTGVVRTDGPNFPDADIFNSLNIYEAPYDEYYMPAAEVNWDVLDALDNASETADDGGAHTPVITHLLCQGGSFMGQSLRLLYDWGIAGDCTYAENTYILRNGFTETQWFEDFSETNLMEDIEASEIVILEVNEEKLPNMSFGFLEYVTEQIAEGK